MAKTKPPGHGGVASANRTDRPISLFVRRSRAQGVLRIGVDTGGTFTDFVCLREGRLEVYKCRSTPEDPSVAILDGIGRFREADKKPAVERLLSQRTPHVVPSSSQVEVVHGSTVATNAVLERKGARVALVATEGFEDVLQIGRQNRPELYNLFVPPRRPLVEPELVFGVPERLDATGQVLLAVDMRAVDKLATLLQRREMDIVAVCLLHSYINPVHERKVAERLRRAGL